MVLISAECANQLLSYLEQDVPMCEDVSLLDIYPVLSVHIYEPLPVFTETAKASLLCVHVISPKPPGIFCAMEANVD